MGTIGQNNRDSGQAHANGIESAYHAARLSEIVYNPIDIWSWDGVERIDLTEASTSAVKNMGYMFRGYQGESLDLSSFDTSNVTYMSQMFYECKNLTSLDLSGFDTSNVTHMQWMFSGDKALETICVSDFWNTDAVKFSVGMLAGCTVELADMIGVVFYVNMNDQVKTAVMEGVPGKVTRTDPKPLSVGEYKGCVKLIYPVNATEVRHTIKLRLYDEDGKQLPLYNSDYRRAPNDTISFSVQDYIEQAPQQYASTDEKAMKLIAALDNYCKAASN